MDFKKLRKDNKLSQIETAKRLRVHLNTWINWERGCGQPSPENLKKIEKLLLGLETKKLKD